MNDSTGSPELNRALDILMKLRGPLADVRPRWRHKKRGTVYVVLGTGCLQTAESEKLDDQQVTIYHAEGGGCVYVRPTYEFEDGRFERVQP